MLKKMEIRFLILKFSRLIGDNIALIIPSCEEITSWSGFDKLTNKNSFIYLMEIVYESYIHKFMH